MSYKRLEENIDQLEFVYLSLDGHKAHLITNHATTQAPDHAHNVLIHACLPGP